MGGRGGTGLVLPRLLVGEVLLDDCGRCRDGGGEGLRVSDFSCIMRGSTGSFSRLSMCLGCHGRTWVGVVPGAVRGPVLGRCGEIEWIGVRGLTQWCESGYDSRLSRIRDARQQIQCCLTIESGIRMCEANSS